MAISMSIYVHIGGGGGVFYIFLIDKWTYNAPIDPLHIQGVVTAICPVIPSAIAILRTFWSRTLCMNSKWRDRSYMLVYMAVYYKKSSDQDTSKGRSSDQASFKGWIKRSSPFWWSNFLIAVAGGSTGHVVVTTPWRIRKKKKTP